MITSKMYKNGTKAISSSYFQDIKMLEDSIRETKQEAYIPRWQKSAQNKQMDTSALEIKNVLMRIDLAKKGIAEINEYLDHLSNQARSHIKVNWGPVREYVSYEDLIEQRNELEAQLADPSRTDKDVIQEEIAEVQKEIDKFDEFVDTAINRINDPELVVA